MELLDNRTPFVTLDNLCAPSVVRADRVYFDAVSWTRKRFEYFQHGNPDLPCVFERLSSRDFNIERHTDGVFCVVKEGVIISTPQGRNLEYLFPEWDILYLDQNTQDLNDRRRPRVSLFGLQIRFLMITEIGWDIHLRLSSMLMHLLLMRNTSCVLDIINRCLIS